MKYKLYNELLGLLLDNLETLPDKPEESAEATLKALWLAASGEPISAQMAIEKQLPDLDVRQIECVKEFVTKRLQGTPLAHLTKRQQFMGIELLAGPEALIPRKETELLGSAAIKLLHNILENQKSALVIDVCTGAGNLPIAYAINLPNIHVYAADVSWDAVSLANRNVKSLQLEDRVHIRKGNLLDPFDDNEFIKKIDLLTCNPPYISSAKVETMHQEIRNHEPRLAFDGGAFGINILNNLIQQAPTYLKEGGWLAFEVGLGQGQGIMKRMSKSNNFINICSVDDSNGDVRVILAQV